MSNQTPEAPKKKSKRFVIILLVLIVGGGAFGITKYIHALHHEETDDAQIEANISPVISRISGYVQEVRVKDNQHVKKGDTLLLLDDRDLSLKLKQTEAALATAQSNLGSARTSSTAATANIASSQASINTIDAQIETAKVNLWRATQDFNRYQNLVKDHSITQQQFEEVSAAKQTAERQLEVLAGQKKQAASQTHAVSSQSLATSSQIGIAHSVIAQRRVDVDEAKLNLSYAAVTAPADGVISRVNVQPGQYLQAGQSTFSIVLNDEIWVVANFKETQYKKMQVGQAVSVHVDAFDAHEFKGKVSSFAPATGARFALLPPDNASGNFVKVVQRLPVKIDFTDANDALLKRLRAGLNVDVDVHLD